MLVCVVFIDRDGLVGSARGADACDAAGIGALARVDQLRHLVERLCNVAIQEPKIRSGLSALRHC